jgi:hypothetical protein
VEVVRNKLAVAERHTPFACERAADNGSDANPSSPAPTAEPLPALAEPVSESAAMITAAATVTLYTMRTENPSLGNSAALPTTSCECRARGFQSC